MLHIVENKAASVEIIIIKDSSYTHFHWPSHFKNETSFIYHLTWYFNRSIVTYRVFITLSLLIAEKQKSKLNLCIICSEKLVVEGENANSRTRQALSMQSRVVQDKGAGKEQHNKGLWLSRASAILTLIIPAVSKIISSLLDAKFSWRGEEAHAIK